MLLLQCSPKVDQAGCIVDKFGPPDISGLGFGVPMGSADLLARRTCGRLKIQLNPPPPPLCTHKAEHAKGGLWPL